MLPVLHRARRGVHRAAAGDGADQAPARIKLQLHPMGVEWFVRQCLVDSITQLRTARGVRMRGVRRTDRGAAGPPRLSRIPPGGGAALHASAARGGRCSGAERPRIRHSCARRAQLAVVASATHPHTASVGPAVLPDPSRTVCRRRRRRWRRDVRCCRGWRQPWHCNGGRRGDFSFEFRFRGNTVRCVHGRGCRRCHAAVWAPLRLRELRPEIPPPV
mmetsp:Transcript_18256/g.47689  ORF Transcript_18256/g.47689 Transcript_18256/m.47689 type:complete len:217 (+) Transcript_18256:1030-1680(+)